MLLPDKSTTETKDFAEHLRSVHFSLAAVCLGLLVIVSQPTRPELRTAYEQAREISQVSLTMDKDLVENEAIRQVHEPDMKDSPAFGNVDRLQSPPKAIDIAGEKYDVVFDGRNWGFVPLDRSIAKLRRCSVSPLPVHVNAERGSTRRRFVCQRWNIVILLGSQVEHRAYA